MDNIKLTKLYHVVIITFCFSDHEGINFKGLDSGKIFIFALIIIDICVIFHNVLVSDWKITNKRYHFTFLFWLHNVCVVSHTSSENDPASFLGVDPGWKCVLSL